MPGNARASASTQRSSVQRCELFIRVHLRSGLTSLPDPATIPDMSACPGCIRREVTSQTFPRDRPEDADNARRTRTK